MTWAQMSCEQITTLTDKDCYLAGERLCVRVDVTDDGAPSASKVAYVEVADNHRLFAQTMVALTDGQGWAEIALPDYMHSGCYQITTYTRAMRNFGPDSFGHTLIGVINGETLSRQDNIQFLPYDSIPQEECASYQPGQEIAIELPDFGPTGYAVSVCGTGIATDLPASVPSVPTITSQPTTRFAPEVEGHIVRAKISSGIEAEVEQTRLAMIGKNASLCDGQRQTDGSYLYYTTAIYGNLPVLIHAYDTLGYAVPMELVSPYAAVLPKELPQLTVYCQEEALKQRATDARKQMLVNRWLEVDTLRHSVGFMSAEPDHFYDLDEWTQMNDVEELLLEFVRGIKRQKYHGLTQLYTYDKQAEHYSRWAALVLLDGIPIYDIDEILHYDAHLIRYVQIYSGIFNFGQSCHCGIISFITRKGRLSNYKLKAEERMMSYAFPQDRPQFVNHTASTTGTLLWLPAIQSHELRLLAPDAPGRYQITMQGIEASGTLLTKRIYFEVRN